jgi:hypothetical protein
MALVPRTWWLKSSGIRVVLDLRVGWEKRKWDASGSHCHDESHAVSIAGYLTYIWLVLVVVSKR